MISAAVHMLDSFHNFPVYAKHNKEKGKDFLLCKGLYITYSLALDVSFLRLPLFPRKCGSDKETG